MYQELNFVYKLFNECMLLYHTDVKVNNNLALSKHIYSFKVRELLGACGVIGCDEVSLRRINSNDFGINDTRKGPIHCHTHLVTHCPCIRRDGVALDTCG